MKLVKEWKLVVTRFYSFRLAIIAGIFGGFEVVLQIFQDGQTIVPKGVFAGIAALVSFAAAVSRLIAQKRPKRGR